jgi:hypothetical protein
MLSSIKRRLLAYMLPAAARAPAFDPSPYDIYAILVNELGHDRTERVQRQLAKHNYKIVRAESTIGIIPQVVWGRTLRARARRSLKRKVAAIHTFVSSWGARSA